MIDRTDQFWWKDAIIYQLHVKAFFDANNDGVGDFEGLTEKLDYVRDLGATAIWIMPFYPSPLRDDGYDIADYRNVNPAFGSMRDFRRLVREAHQRNLRVITELVINHTSDQHPWFQRARAAKPGSAARDFYVWSDTDKKYSDARIIFLDTETSNWTWDAVAGAYYWHRFYSHQPDLNFDNPKVLEAVIDTMRFWFDIGVDGLRLDAIPYLIERDGTNCENLAETHDVIRRIRSALEESHPDRMLLAEANQWPEETAEYFGKGDECHMAFHFPLMPRMYMALAMEDRHPITDIMRQTPEIPDSSQWAIFLRNHDELTLEMVTDRERDYLWSFYASDRRARINLGIRRRLAPLLANDRHKAELLASLLFTMPGTPVMYYGDEIGMGDNIYLGDRDGVRTPMQWSPDRNGGFSRADPARLYLPAIQDPIYGFNSVNVEAQLSSPASLLNWTRRMVAIRRNHRALSRGALRFVYPSNRKVLAYIREIDDERILCVCNVSRSPQAGELDLSEFKGSRLVELTGGSVFPQIGSLPYLITLPGYSFYWFSLDSSDAEEKRFGPSPAPELFTLVLKGDAGALLTGREAVAFERTVAPAFLSSRRWSPVRNVGVRQTSVQTLGHLQGIRTKRTYLLNRVGVTPRFGSPQTLFAPLAINEVEEEESVLPYAVARVRRGARVGLLYDADADPHFGGVIATHMKRGSVLPANDGGRLHFHGVEALGESQVEELDSVRLGGDQSNSTLLIGDEAVLKIYRRLHDGPNPELEMSRYLTEVAQFDGSPEYLGSLTHVNAEGVSTALAIMQRYVRNQGDGWTRTLDAFRLALEELVTPPPGQEPSLEEAFAAYLPRAEALGRRTGQMHCALARSTDDPCFAPERLTQEDLALAGDEMRVQATRAHEQLRRALADASEAQCAQMTRFIEAAPRLDAWITSLTHDPVNAMKFRVHGDYHLGQTLIAQTDVMIVDFEGEPSRSVAERRAKDTPLRDVAGMLRSISYAGESAILAVEQRLSTDVARAERIALDGVQLVSTIFMDAYAAQVAGTWAEVPEPSDRKRLLTIKLLSKALYEINYEAEFRPTWLGVPLKSVLALMNEVEPAI